jgi:hypothetical protein
MRAGQAGAGADRPLGDPLPRRYAFHVKSLKALHPSESSPYENPGHQISNLQDIVLPCPIHPISMSVTSDRHVRIIGPVGDVLFSALFPGSGAECGTPRAGAAPP